jgi:hypothetical protein
MVTERLVTFQLAVSRVLYPWSRFTAGEAEDGNRQRVLADRGKKRRRPDSNRGWRICNPLP